MNKFLHSFWVLACILCIVFYTPEVAHSNQSGAPIGKTGSPGDNGSTCASCHGGSISPGISDVFIISSVNTPVEYISGEVYSFTANINGGSGIFGFELVVEDVFGNSIGEIILSDPVNTQLIDGGNYITHTTAGSNGWISTPDGPGVYMNWNFDWLAPSDFEGVVTFYAAGNISNGNEGASGDVILTNSLSLEVASASTDNSGCTNTEATNYNSNATEDDSSCEFNIASSSQITSCGGALYDSGGPSGEYLNNENYTVTIYPEITDEFVSLFFSEFQLESPTWDNMTIYDGENTNAPILINAVGLTELLSETVYASPTNESGALTITFTSDGTGMYAGWAAEIGCTAYGPCFGFVADVIASFESVENASDATATLNITLGNEPFEYYWSTGETTESITGLTSGTYSVSIIDSEGCSTESSFDVIVDPEEYIIGDLLNLTTCNGILYDTGGPDGIYEAGEDLFIRICPEEVGSSSQIEFTEFDLGFDGTMLIYDGMGTANPILTTGTGSSLLGQTIVASEENTTGCLTITFVSTLWWGGASGWEAYISCHDYIIVGCMDTDANNYDSTAEEDNGTCYYAPGCTDNTYVEYHTQGFEADFDDGSCITPFLDDCTNIEALNYNPEATFNLEQDPCIFDLEDWICGMHYKDERDDNTYGSVLIGENCWMTENLNFAYSETNTTPIPEGSATQFETGFIYTGQDDYNSDDNGRYYTWASAASAVPYSWHLPRAQELESLFETFTATDHQMDGLSGFDCQMSGGVILPTGELQFMNQGNTTWLWSDTEEDEGNASALTMISTSMNPNFDVIPKSFALSIRAVFGFPQGTVLGCTDVDYIEFNEDANTDDGSCVIVAIDGCTDETALNYSEIATVNDDSCIPYIEGCMNEEYVEFNEEATVEDGSCELFAVPGCTDESAQNFDEAANLDDDSCIAHVLGCTDSAFAEYDVEATLDDGTCTTTTILGCTDDSAFNYNSAANVDDDSCLPYIEGCTDINYVEFNGLANVDDGTCIVQVILGCTIDYALNYNTNANTDDGSCNVEGCTNDLFIEYDLNANIDNGTCSIFAIWGCTNDLYLEYFPPANSDDESCETFIVEGCLDPIYIEYSADANVEDGSCDNFAILGCTDIGFLEYNPDAVVDNNTCLTPLIAGCMDAVYLEYSNLVNYDDGSCLTLLVVGCTDAAFIEYSALANSDDGSCTFIILYGCTDENYTEYNPNTNVDNGSCITSVVFGCIDPLAFNFNPEANTDDASCVPIVFGCFNPDYIEYNSFANTQVASLCITLAELGCTNEEAINYNSSANTDDGSCIMSLIEIASEGFANGGMLFVPTILGLGADYELFWTFGNGTTSSELNPLVFFTSNGTFEVTLVVNNGAIEVSTTIYVDILNAVIGIDELSSSRTILTVNYFDLIGRQINIEDRVLNQVYIKQTIYDDGYKSHTKMIISE